MTSPFLELPTELRQKIFLETISDEDLLERIELRAQPIGSNKWKANPNFELSSLPAPSWAYACSTFAVDLPWVKEQWIGRASDLGSQKEKAWNAIFGESFRLEQTVHYTHPNPGITVQVVPIKPTGTNIGMVVYPSSTIVPHTFPSAVFDSQNERLLAREVVRQSPGRLGPTANSHFMITGSIKLDI